ncbi:MAG TPA: hypothetical protein VFE62_15510 [Gemmataceae bacterium]|nr:hypothetical protein [Gemmataceae bacterium]
MHASARVFLKEIIDYAGLFPPAKLPLDQAAQNYLDASNDSGRLWMLRSFVCPTAQLPELATKTSRPLGVAALGTAVTRLDAFMPQLDADMRLIRESRAASAEAIISTYEVALPAGLACTQLGDVIEPFVEALRNHGLRGFLEIPLSRSWETDVSNLGQAIDAWRKKSIEDERVKTGFDLHPLSLKMMLGIKLRCGGLKPAAFPSDAQVAHFIERCREANVRWKATAGLHHPRRHWDENLKVWHHGFLNVFLAGILARTQRNWPKLTEILADRELGDLRFEGDRMAWKFWECDKREIAIARNEFATSFGSCSFDEPVADLQAMGLL